MSPPRTSMRRPPGMAGSPPPVGSPGLMEDLADSFSSAFNVTNTPNDVNRPHPRFSQYKAKTAVADQETRRARMLEHQKSKRDDLVNLARALAMGDFEEEDGEEEEEEEMDTSGGEVKQRRLRKTY